MKLSEKLTSMFGTGYIVKSKQAQKLIENDKIEVVSCSYIETLESYLLRVNKTTKSMGAERNVSIRAKEQKDGTWWIYKN